MRGSSQRFRYGKVAAHQTIKIALRAAEWPE
jgi:hypothetical protein